MSNIVKISKEDIIKIVKSNENYYLDDTLNDYLIIRTRKTGKFVAQFKAVKNGK
jgi:hypothetical protein